MGKKRPISATIDESLIAWIDQILATNSSFRNKSHLIENALNEYRERYPSRKR